MPNVAAPQSPDLCKPAAATASGADDVLLLHVAGRRPRAPARSRRRCSTTRWRHSRSSPHRGFLLRRASARRDVTDGVSGYAGGGADPAYYEVVGTEMTDMRNQFGSPLIPAGAMVHPADLFFGSPKIQPGSTAKSRTSGPSTARAIFPTNPEERTLARPTSRSSTKWTCLMLRWSPSRTRRRWRSLYPAQERYGEPQSAAR